MKMDKALTHMEFHHQKADGWITMAKKENGQFKQYHYRKDEMASQLSEWLGEDVYFSQNTFYKPQRRIENIRQLRSLYVDVDHYLFNYDPSWVIGKMELELFGNSVPEPNIIIHSGRGFIVVWLLDPIPYQALPLWQAVERYLCNQFKSLGGDPKATDAARVFRLAGTTNSKNGEEVTVQYRHEHRYSLREIQEEYLPDLSPVKETAKRGRPTKVVQLYNTYRLHHARFNDLKKLIELRNYDVKGYRETLCFLYRYWGCCFLQDPAEALEATLELNAAFKEPLHEREVIKATRSAERAWQAKNNKEANRLAREKGYPGAGYNITNKKLIEWLNITLEEQTQLQTIIGRREKYNRNNERREIERRESGIMTRQEYLARAEERRLKAIMLKAQGLSNYKIGDILECSEGEVRRLLKKI